MIKKTLLLKAIEFFCTNSSYDKAMLRVQAQHLYQVVEPISFHKISPMHLCAVEVCSVCVGLRLAVKGNAYFFI